MGGGEVGLWKAELERFLSGKNETTRGRSITGELNPGAAVRWPRLELVFVVRSVPRSQSCVYELISSLLSLHWRTCYDKNAQMYGRSIFDLIPH